MKSKHSSAMLVLVLLSLVCMSSFAANLNINGNLNIQGDGTSASPGNITAKGAVNVSNGLTANTATVTGGLTTNTLTVASTSTFQAYPTAPGIILQYYSSTIAVGASCNTEGLVVYSRQTEPTLYFCVKTASNKLVWNLAWNNHPTANNASLRSLQDKIDTQAKEIADLKKIICLIHPKAAACSR